MKSNTAAPKNLLPGALLHKLETKITRVILVANNPNIAPANLAELDISSSDLVVQFNTMTHFEQLSALPCQHLTVFRFGVAPQKHHGLPLAAPRRARMQALESRQFTLFTDAFPANDQPFPPAQAETLTTNIDELIDAPYPTPDIAHYPQSAGPSTGFWTLALFHHLRQKNRATRAANNNGAFEINLLGFSTESSSKGIFWEGHAWDFERRWINDNGFGIQG